MKKSAATCIEFMQSNMKKPIVNFTDFMKLEFIVGKVVKVHKLKGSKKLLKMHVDLGPEYKTVTVLAGIAQSYTPSKILHKKFIFLANLEPKKMFNATSNGMMLAADIDGKAYIVPVSKKLPNGSTIR